MYNIPLTYEIDARREKNIFPCLLYFIEMLRGLTKLSKNFTPKNLFVHFYIAVFLKAKKINEVLQKNLSQSILVGIRK